MRQASPKQTTSCRRQRRCGYYALLVDWRWLVRAAPCYWQATGVEHILSDRTAMLLTSHPVMSVLLACRQVEVVSLEAVKVAPEEGALAGSFSPLLLFHLFSLCLFCPLTGGDHQPGGGGGGLGTVIFLVFKLAPSNSLMPSLPLRWRSSTSLEAVAVALEQ